jgi:hypothetical protein
MTSSANDGAGLANWSLQVTTPRSDMNVQTADVALSTLHKEINTQNDLHEGYKGLLVVIKLH